MLVPSVLKHAVWVMDNDDDTQHMISGSTSRKLVHAGTGPVFILTWVLYDNDVYSAMTACAVPLSCTLYFLLLGKRKIHDKFVVDTISRTGDATELLLGPLYYGITISIVSVAYWQRPEAIIMIMVLCFGDGFASLVGQCT